jgi:hypothetical protein
MQAPLLFNGDGRLAPQLLESMYKRADFSSPDGHLGHWGFLCQSLLARARCSTSPAAFSTRPALDAQDLRIVYARLHARHPTPIAS